MAEISSDVAVADLLNCGYVGVTIYDITDSTCDF